MSLNWKILLCIYLLSALAFSSCAQKQTEKAAILSSASLQQDFKIFQDTLRKLHAGLYRHRTEAEINKIFDSCSLHLEKGMPLEKFYLMLRFIIASIRDGHTSGSLPERVRNQYLVEANMFPIQPVFIDDRVYLACQPKNINLIAGSELLEIDQKPVNEIRTELLRYLASDGTNITKKYWDLNNGAFAPLYYLVYGGKKTFSIKYRFRNKIASATINASCLSNVECPGTRLPSKRNLQLQFAKDSIAVMTIKAFTGEGLQSTDEYFQFLDSSFTRLSKKKVRHLIIDVRDNGGGYDVFGSALYSHLTTRPFNYYKSLQTTTRLFQKSEHPNLEVQMPARIKYTNRVYILINGQSFSTTAEFCSIAKSYERAIFIGEETGGGYVGNTSGGNARVVLPNTNIIVSIPKIRYTMAVKSPQTNPGGIVPDHIVISQIDDILNRRDVQLDFAINLAAGKQQ